MTRLDEHKISSKMNFFFLFYPSFYSRFFCLIPTPANVTILKKKPLLGHGVFIPWMPNEGQQ
jgi:hypothetical protein